MTKINQKAFSLIELSIVILIIGILVAGVTQSSRLVNQFRDTNIRQITVNSPVYAIKDLVLWLETTQTESFVESEAADGVVVNQWFDYNKQATVKAQVNAIDQRATYRSSGINKLPALYFNGRGWFVASGIPSTTNNLKTVFVVAMTENYNQAHYIFDNTSCTQFCLIITSSSARNLTLHSGASFAFGNILAQKPYIYTGVFNGANSLIRINGQQSATSNAGGNPMFKDIRVGGSCVAPGYNENFVGHIGEFIVFDRVLKADEYQDVEKYLSTKWGIKF